MSAALEFHPLANLFPLIEGEEFAALVADIRVNGLREPITIHENKILDGRNRFRACIAAGLGEALAAFPEKFFLAFAGPDPIAYVISANIHRRHLTTQQRAAIAAELATMKSGARTDLASFGARSDAQAADALKVSERSVERAKKRMREDPEAHAKAKAGTLSRARRRLRQNLGQTRAEAFEQRHPELLGTAQRPLVYLFDSADAILRDMAKVAKRAEDGDEAALRHIIDGAKLLTHLCLRIEQFARQRAEPTDDDGEAAP